MDDEAVSTKKRLNFNYSKILSVTAIILVAISFAYLNWQNHLLQTHLQQLSSNQQQQSAHANYIKQQFNQLRQQQIKQQQQNQADLAALQNRYQQQLQKASQIKTVNQASWNILSAIYLTKLAQYKMHYEHDNQQAISLLMQARDALQKQKSKLAKQVQLALQTNIMAIKNQPQVNRNHLYQTLTNFSNKIKQLPTTTHKQTATALTHKKTETRSWRQSLEKSWQSLKGLITVRHDQNSDAALIAPQQASYLKENLHQMILQAQIAVLQYNNTVYRLSMMTAKKWLKQYFVISNNKVQQAILQLYKLSHINLRNKAINLSNTLQLLKQLQQRQTK